MMSKTTYFLGDLSSSLAVFLKRNAERSAGYTYTSVFRGEKPRVRFLGPFGYPD